VEARVVGEQISNPVSPGWALLISDLGVNPSNVLRRAGLPRDLFNGGHKITPEQFFALWRGIEGEVDEPLLLPLQFGKVISLEAFDVPLFAATCSPNLNVAAKRLSQHKKLIGPQRLTVSESDTETVLGFSWPADLAPPWSVAITELVFWVALARLATRSKVYPVRATAPEPPVGAAAAAYREYLGVPIASGPGYAVAFSEEDAARPFLTANDAMWEFFEPELRRRLSELDAETTIAEKVRAALLEMLPAGDGSMAGVARELAMSTRTLQRRLNEEESTFQDVLSDTRESLARHYLSASNMSASEISFLLGYDDPRSFYRAFQAWTGQTPQLVRSAATG